MKVKCEDGKYSVRVYCEDCKYLKGRSGPQEYMRCEYPSNISVTQSWFSAREGYKLLPAELNDDNDCEWHETYKPSSPPGDE